MNTIKNNGKKKTRHLNELTLEPAIQSCDSGQWIAFYDSCQLTIIWMSTVKFCVEKHRLYALDT